jgi:hypothetical protein
MRALHTLFLSTLAAAALTACGGGSDAAAPSTTTPAAGGPVTSASVADTPLPSAAPTATIAATQATADALKAEVAAAFTASQKTALTRKLSFLSAAADSTGVERAQEVVADQCSLSGTLDSELPIAKILDGKEKAAVGTNYNLTFNKCKNGTPTDPVETNGKWTINFSRYASDTDLAFIALFNGITVTTKTETVTVNGGLKCDYRGPIQSCALSDGTRGWDTSMSYSGGVLNGTYATKYADGTVTVKYVNYSDTGGTATITGKSPTKMVITRTTVGGATSVKIDITGADGITKSY